jgi:NADPH:quinone reductase-like Zn-dependent oxidoreductase
MKAVHVTHFAERGNISLATDVPKPTLAKDGDEGKLLVRVLACALNPADCRLMDGGVSLVMAPKQFPYVPGLDICGVIEQIGGSNNSLKSLHESSLRVGDRIIAALPAMEIGGLSEYVAIDSARAALAPPEAAFSHLEAASLPTAGCTALQALQDARLEPGSRIVVLGGSGGVGSLVIQLATARGARVVAATSTNSALVTALGAEQVVDYRAAKWWDAVAPQSIDAVVDCVGCDDSWANCGRALRRGGRYVAVVDSPESEIRSVGQLLAFVLKIARRSLNPFSPSYTLVSCFPQGRELAALVAAMAPADGKTCDPRAVLDPQSPFSMTVEGVASALEVQRSHRAKGKLVVQVSS